MPRPARAAVARRPVVTAALEDALLGELGYLLFRHAERHPVRRSGRGLRRRVHPIPEGRFDPGQEPKLGSLLVSAAADISADLRGAGFLRDT